MPGFAAELKSFMEMNDENNDRKLSEDEFCKAMQKFAVNAATNDGGAGDGDDEG